jgi:hypothetical protein
MAADTISLPENIVSLRQELAQHYRNPDFLACDTMGEIVKASLRQVLKEGEHPH